MIAFCLLACFYFSRIGYYSTFGMATTPTLQPLKNAFVAISDIVFAEDVRVVFVAEAKFPGSLVLDAASFNELPGAKQARPLNVSRFAG